MLCTSTSPFLSLPTVSGPFHFYLECLVFIVSTLSPWKERRFHFRVRAFWSEEEKPSSTQTGDLIPVSVQPLGLGVPKVECGQPATSRGGNDDRG